jgi:hypothetical protein
MCADLGTCPRYIFSLRGELMDGENSKVEKMSENGLIGMNILSTSTCMTFTFPLNMP